MEQMIARLLRCHVMNRTDRMYAIVEELRARSPRPVSVPALAERFEVSSRTVERDLLALQEAGVPIYAETGRLGGYVLDTARTLPPLNFTASEATAIAVALGTATASPFATTARAALTKIMAAMSDADVAAARALGRRVLVFEAPSAVKAPPVPRAVEQAITERRVLRLRYVDRNEQPTDRVVEPLVVIGVAPNWYLGAWCRLRDDVRMFRLDRIRDAFLTRESAPERDVPPLEVPDLHGRRVIE
jgi:predicted DNA-binding transcriptional regulator YafY